MIKHIKIFGERNSGTTFLKALLRENITDINIYSGGYNDGSGWKHGFPQLNLFNDLNEILFIFIIRDLEAWLISMYNNPYHFIRPDNITKFISDNLHIKDLRMDHDVHTNKKEQQNIISLRYAKIKSYESVFDEVPNAIFINLENLQQNTNTFLYFMQDIYSLNLSPSIKQIVTHTKKNITSVNRKYDTILPTIHKKDITIEQRVVLLKEAYRFKRSNTVKLDDIPNGPDVIYSRS